MVGLFILVQNDKNNFVLVVVNSFYLKFGHGIMCIIILGWENIKKSSYYYGNLNRFCFSKLYFLKTDITDITYKVYLPLLCENLLCHIICF